MAFAITFACLVVACAACIVVIRRAALASYSQLRATLQSLAVEYPGKVCDQGGLEGLAADLTVDGWLAQVATRIARRRKYVNEYDVRVSVRDPDGRRSVQRILSIREASSIDTLRDAIFAALQALAGPR